MTRRLMLSLMLAAGLATAPALADVDVRNGAGKPAVVIGTKRPHSQPHVQRHYYGPPVTYRYYGPPILYHPGRYAHRPHEYHGGRYYGHHPHARPPANGNGRPGHRPPPPHRAHGHGHGHR